MTTSAHTLGPTCAYYEDATDWSKSSFDPPRVKAQFFYISTVPIDDPLSPLPAIQTDAKASRSKHPPQPFSARDNASLEEAWHGLRAGRNAEQEVSKEAEPPGRGRTLGEMIRFPKFKSGDKPSAPTSQDSRQRDNQKEPEALITGGGRPWTTYASSRSIPQSRVRAVASINENEVSRSLPDDSHKEELPVVKSNRNRLESEPHVLLDDDKGFSNGRSVKTVESEELDRPDSNQKRKRTFSPFRHRSKEPRNGREESPVGEAELGQTDSEIERSPSIALALDQETNISGRPFARAPSYRPRTGIAPDEDEDQDSQDASETASRGHYQSRIVSRLESQDKPVKAFVPVGVSRLHLVEMPSLLMKPIYWSPINDISVVLRATWFYRGTMLPVESDLANQLETGYESLRPWQDVWQDELNSCVEHGAKAELKVVHRLWPDERRFSRAVVESENKNNVQELGNGPLSAELPGPEHQENVADDPQRESNDFARLFKNHGVFYVNQRDAQILKPSLLPSESRGRKPLGQIRKGREIGIAVVRGFDREAWDRIHPPPKLNTKAAHAKIGAYLSQSGDAATSDCRPSCPACKMEEQKPKVTDLILVIHGIGQKLSERVDSFHFTHAINSFRREVNVELSNEAVAGHLKGGASGIMILPVNWRLTVSFNEEDSTGKKKMSTENNFQLKDITPDTIPAVRSLVSDVMLDIPYYLSHHKAKMISAVVREANRVYRLWCRNNPGFHEHGRVHMIAHSLGSAMAMDILSHQPTRLPDHIDPLKGKPTDEMFEFDTTNLFACGSPAGFFLLLNKASLVPRRGRDKPGAAGEDESHRVAGEVGTYGCLAVDNYYNIMHRNDPVAYQVNAAVDQEYAALLVPAYIPSANVGFLSKVGHTFGWSSTPSNNAYDSGAGQNRPGMNKLPSTMEMNTHDFTREQLAEKRMYLLNDNGQIDFYLSSGGGPLELQYLNMLGAHSSYWVMQDFIRFLVVEILREPGRAGTVGPLQAQKRRDFKRGKIA